MADADSSFTHATDSLIALYRTVERRTLDQPLLSVMPILINFWEALKFCFFLIVNLFIIPVNFVILIRNFFPGHWKYRPFFLHQLCYIWLWVWRGEAPMVPLIFIRPLFNAFVKGHFERRLRRLRLEIILHNQISDATRAALVGRLDDALERSKFRRFAAFLALLPGIVPALAWTKQFTDFLGMSMPVGTFETFVSKNMSNISGDGVLLSVYYLLYIPATAFLAKRGLFIGRPPGRIWFPGGQSGDEVYFREREILAGVGLHARELRIDLWIVGVSFVIFFIHWLVGLQSLSDRGQIISYLIGLVLGNGLYSIALLIAAIRRPRTGRL